MDQLNAMQCEACRVGAPKVTEQEAMGLLEQIPNWSLIRKEGIDQLERTFEFTDFVTALQFTNSIGEAAELNGHHPAILTEWGSVTVTWWTHKIRGLHQNDFVMAAKTDSIFAS
ncbi:MAG: 4a-hydroxytetrahydrobiopterin dehydratase [Gemmatimonadetes bacterium]|mgnify:FL=1|nr:4a-hydroxytetrahydrobiopterin dehydratase [Gemmatimonadota bacterium]|tara:strand:- start:312 stop:653 length:342 start_codon:yes stop_codon:yes gene_type:complete